MGREVRRVPANWQHPKVERWNYLKGRRHADIQSIAYNEADRRATAQGLTLQYLKAA